MFLDGHEAAEEGVQGSRYQSIKYVLTHLAAAGPLFSILAINIDKWSHPLGIMDAKANRVASSQKIMEPILMRELDRAAKVARNDRPSSPLTAADRCHHPSGQPWTLEVTHGIKKAEADAPAS